MSRRLSRRFEVVTAWIGAIGFVAALASGGFPDSYFENDLVVALLTVVAGCLLFSWLFLSLLYVYRMLMGQWEYSLVKILAVLFVPVVGVVWLSIKGVPDALVNAPGDDPNCGV